MRLVYLEIGFLRDSYQPYSQIATPYVEPSTISFSGCNFHHKIKQDDGN